MDLKSKNLKFNLTQDEATRRLKQYGLNEIAKEIKKSWWRRFFKIFEEPMLFLLVLASLIYLVIGELSEGLMLFFSIFIIIGISFYQDFKSEKALESLKKIASPKALVIRDGIEKRISAVDLVPGDLVILREGDRVPADGIILETSHLNVDESLLTGESFAVNKMSMFLSAANNPELTEKAEDLAHQRIIFSEVNNKYKAFTSTLVMSGNALMKTVNTGFQTEVGKIGKILQEEGPEDLNLKKEINQIVRFFIWTGSLICFAIIIIYGLSRQDWLQAFLVGLATAMSLLPEEFPVVLTVFLALGSWRLSKLNVLVRKASSIERLGAINILCVDKTGTLTQNKMSVTALSHINSTVFIDSKNVHKLEEEYHKVIEFALLASHIDAFDPMEKSIKDMVLENEWGKDHFHKEWVLKKDYPLSNKLLAMSCVWQSPDNSKYIIASKGAPEAIIDLCHLSLQDKNKILDSVKVMAEKGLRVLGVASCYFESQLLPTDQHDFQFTWIGLVGLADPLRQEVVAAVEKCHQAGIRLIMMTGDYSETALKIAEQAGLVTNQMVLTGQQMKNISDIDLKEQLKKVNIFARMIPEQKLRIVKLLKEEGHIVAMTGDGVNDAPSLKWADVGISMGARGTDVAREASDIVLLDDNFSSIVSGIERGRFIFTNIKKAMSYIISIHVPIAGLSIFPVLLGWPIFLMPVHIVLLELIIDPASSLMFENQFTDKKIMHLPPRSLNERLLSASEILRSFLQGLLLLIVVMGVLIFFSTNKNIDPNHSRTFAFIVLCLGNLAFIFADMSAGSLTQLALILKRKSSLLIIFFLVLFLQLVMQNTITRKLFHFDQLTTLEFFMALGISFLIFIIVTLWNKFKPIQFFKN